MSSRFGIIVLVAMGIAPVCWVALVGEAEWSFLSVWGWVQKEDWKAWNDYQAHQLALGYGRGRRCPAYRGPRASQEGNKRGRDWRRRIMDWEHLKPVLKELVEAAVEGSEPGDLSKFRLSVQMVVVIPDYSQTLCPICGGPTKCHRSYYIHPQDIDLVKPTVLQVYREVCECCNTGCQTRITPELYFVDKGGRFTKRVKQKAIASVVEDGMPLGRVPQRMLRDFHVRVAKSTVFEWVQAEAEADLGKAEYTQWVAARFSGVVGLDEVHLHDRNGKKQYLIVAVDPINNRTILFDLIDSRDSDAIKAFLERLKKMGVNPTVVVTDMWKAYHSALRDVFPEVEHQLCVFHVIQAVMKHTNKALMTYRRDLPKETEAQKAVRKDLWDHRYLLLKANHKVDDIQRQLLKESLKTHPGTMLPKAYGCKEAILALFRKSRDKNDARRRRNVILKQFGDVPELEKVLNVIRGNDFEQMIVYLDYENLDKTNNNAERENRVYQKGEKVRYRARTKDTRLNYVKLRARQRNQHSVERNIRLRRRSKSQPVSVNRANTRIDQIARPLAA